MLALIHVKSLIGVLNWNYNIDNLLYIVTGCQCVAIDEGNKEMLQRADGNLKEDDLIYK